ncbi:MAG: response regulator [Verrucomicrobia bacterium]|nr:response regulator [Verrucomicrobiota bacterium]
MNALAVLVIDDEESIRDLLGAILQHNGHKVTTAATGKAALQLIGLGDHAFDLMITDIIMPDMDGIEIISAAKKLRPDLRIMAISGGGNLMSSHDCLRMAKMIGARTVLAKPFNEKQLNEAIEQTFAPVPG